ncbi:lysozyme inhibitor LprI family protein [Aureimonas sp. ME7]|uniref:lysozyme inhibitor LprI family protein n=1 Tax=Aureimonas sp. ME7 TaxID=2744252 RepID=UPI0015F61696|nr:lysozyme inhibitor LprI family protein [Aureimonas sp. ME7]
MRTFAFCIVAVLIGSTMASAADICDDQTTQTALSACAAQQFEQADDKLNTAYAEVLERLEGEPPRRDLLRAAQRAWVAFRDAECTFAVSGTEGGSAEPMVNAQCRAELTDRRTGDLKDYLACGEGDLSCPLPPN